MTGAGRGIGRAYAQLLARRGASVVVNDLGGSIEGRGADPGPAARVADEIAAEGGVAVADTSDVSTAAGARDLIDFATTRFGRLDILINNAGIIRWAGLPEADEANLASHLAVHLYGSFHTARAAWPHMVDRGYGRILMTTSSGIFGLADNLSYAAAKGAVIGLTRSLAVSGRKLGIKVNLIAPAAMTRMAAPPAAPGAGPAEPTVPGGAGSAPAAMSADLVAPMAAFLVHENCPVTGEIYAAGARRFARVVIASAEGYVIPGPQPTIEDVADHWAQINDLTTYHVPSSLPSWSAAFLAHLDSVDLGPDTPA